MKVSDKMKEAIKRSRKFSPTMWLSEQTGLYYIGYGHIIPVNKVKEFIGVKITKKMSEELFEEDMWNCQSFVNKTIGLQGHCFREDIPQNHFDVMCHIRYDIGESKLLKDSSFFLLYKKGLIAESAERIMVWKKYKGNYCSSLFNRRKLDYQIFTTNDYTQIKNSKKDKKEPTWMNLN